MLKFINKLFGSKSDRDIKAVKPIVDKIKEEYEKLSSISHDDLRAKTLSFKERTDFEIKAKSFAIGELIKEERKLAQMTQEQLADKIGAKKSFISRIENGHSDIQLSTLYKIIEFGLGRKINLTIQ